MNKLFPQPGIVDKISGEITHAGVADVAKGNAELAIQPVSELMHVEGTEFAGTMPREIQYVSEFSCAAVAGGKQIDAASRLIAFLQSESASKTIASSSMELLGSE